MSRRKIGPVPSESAEQIAFVQWFERSYPNIKIFAIPNGGHRHKATAQRLRMEGVKKGVPDLYIPALKLWIEMKRTTGGTLSKEQKEWRDYLQGIGDKWACCKGAQEAVEVVKEMMK